MVSSVIRISGMIKEFPFLIGKVLTKKMARKKFYLIIDTEFPFLIGKVLTSLFQAEASFNKIDELCFHSL